MELLYHQPSLSQVVDLKKHSFLKEYIGKSLGKRILNSPKMPDKLALIRIFEIYLEA